MNGREIATTLTPYELTVIRLMREESAPDVDFFVCRRDGVVVKAEKNVKYIKEFRKENLPREGGIDTP